MNTPHRLLLVDDHPIVREGLKAFLGLQRDLSVVGEAASLDEAKRQAKAEQPDLILLDLQLEDGHALAILEELRALAPQAKILILTSFLDEFYVQDALRLGASGYVLKHAGPGALLDHVRAVLRGEVPLDPQAVQALDRANENPLQTLTPREREVLAGMAAGHSNKQIARELGVAEKTVKTHATSLFAKLGVRDRTQAALLARNLHL